MRTRGTPRQTRVLRPVECYDPPVAVRREVLTARALDADQATATPGLLVPVPVLVLLLPLRPALAAVVPAVTAVEGPVVG